MKIYVLMLLIPVFFSACAVSSLKTTDAKKLLLQHDNKITMLGSEVLTNELQWYRNIDVYKSKIQNDKTTLLHEYIVTDINWEFKYGPVTTIKYIFDAYDSDVIYMNSSLLFLQLRVSKTQYVNMLAEISATQELSYVYGFSNEEFVSLAKSIVPDSSFLMPKLKHQGIMFSNETKPLSTWSVEMLFLQPLLKQVIRFGVGY